MRITDSPALPPGAETGAVLAIGNFDGVHRGHRALLAQAGEIAAAAGKETAVLTFEPHPRRLFRPDDPPFRLTPAPVKQRLLAGCGVDILASLPFNWDFASQGAEMFIRKILTDGLRPSHIVIGEDFRFGQLRKGSADTLRAAGFPVTAFGKKTDDHGAIISSSVIRQALAEGKIREANALLGWPWEIEGIVAQGDRRGRTIGFPTANVHLGETLHPAYGVYAAWVKIGDEKDWRAGATNIGIRPMFEVPVGQVETYIFDFDRDIYGQRLRVRPVQRLRGEARFDSLESLVAQIGRDCEDIRAILSKTKPAPG